LKESILNIVCEIKFVIIPSISSGFCFNLCADLKYIKMKDLILNNGIIDYKFLKHADLVFDVGLNLGEKAASFLDLGCRVVGFEPQRNIYLQAVNRFKNNGNFIGENVALDDSKGVSTIRIASFHTISSMNLEYIRNVKKLRFSTYSWDSEEVVNTDTLDNMISKYGVPKYIKIDVEGHELNVLRGLTSRIEYISIEFITEMLGPVKECLDYVDRLNEKKSSFNYIYGNNDNFYFEHWIGKDEIIAYLDSVNDRQNEFGDIFIRNKEKG
jgi:FkbM family methyltransferase